ncbi:class I adenylate-forming enzyme family protein [Aliikangiella sp. G2MR2-5]|uniref:class I adenylate-forming enzyme family protein n=1 Tax=Aliikangiella sp. G2MR2-5 TaxID=2788943 RepID=UPI0018AB15A1|nr:class I adenylate-forming enzyme family protein [Aliikangiella sp. G2MR2-5]
MSLAFDKTLPAQLRSIASRFPDNVALLEKSDNVSYLQLEELIDRAGSYLKSTGVTTGDRVAIVMDNSIDYVVAFYAIWKVGGIVVALNPLSKLHEIEKLLTQSGASCLILDKASLEDISKLKALDIRIITRTKQEDESITCWQSVVEHESDGLWFDAKGEDLAQIIYTSGTTGNPKGVLLSHANLMSNMVDIIDYLALTENDAVLNVLPFHYCYGNSVLHTHLCVGGKVIFAGSMAFPQEIVNNMHEFKATGFSGVPSTYTLFLTRSDWPQNPPPLRYVTQAGGPMGKPLTEKLVAACNQNTQLFVMYGQTEASARLTYLPPKMLNKKLGSAGIPLNNVCLEIRDEQGNKLPAGEQGEVYVSGPSIMQGYWQNSAASDQVLIKGWLKTGDLGYLDDDGFLFLIGRNSDMIKVGAHRINPMELEEVINKLPQIQESAVIGIEDEILGQKLRAFIVGEESKENLFALKKHCNEYLPPHKMPREFVWVAALPKTASGKIKRFELNR